MATLHDLRRNALGLGPVQNEVQLRTEFTSRLRVRIGGLLSRARRHLRALAARQRSDTKERLVVWSETVLEHVRERGWRYAIPYLVAYLVAVLICWNM